QCAGFLKIPESSDELDNTWVHPENYEVARELLQVIKSGQSVSNELRTKLKEAYNVGDTTLSDIIEELKKQNRDPRENCPMPIMQQGVLSFDDLSPGMKVTGKVRNVVDFGAFVDIGLHETALIHISELSDDFVKDPMEFVKVGDVKDFTILSLDKDRMRISLSLKSDAAFRSTQSGSAKDSQKVTKIGPQGKQNETSSSKKKVVVKKSFSGEKNESQTSRKNYNDTHNDGMTYNPFASLLKK
ncbi:MAG: S1 RNA-binding domain-containing protein, partial [Treponema sp.]|nr:S1 RNA-binding domain-containing protein [Treponema sp.]